MSDDLPRHVFDPGSAVRYRPNPSFVKTAILVEPGDPDATIVVRARFGPQTLRGAFYVVADGTGSYGASRAEFEATHEVVGPNRWVKSEGVLAYPATESCRVETHIGGTLEASVAARPGDWIVRQSTGEVMAMTSDEFAARYVEDDNGSESS